MAFDVDGAKASGYSDAEIADYLSQEQKFDAPSARQAGYSDGEIINHLNSTPEPAPVIAPEQKPTDTTSSVFSTVASALKTAASDTYHKIVDNVSEDVDAVKDIAKRIPSADEITGNVQGRILKKAGGAEVGIANAFENSASDKRHSADIYEARVNALQRKLDSEKRLPTDNEKSYLEFNTQMVIDLRHQADEQQQHLRENPDDRPLQGLRKTGMNLVAAGKDTIKSTSTPGDDIVKRTVLGVTGALPDLAMAYVGGATGGTRGALTAMGTSSYGETYADVLDNPNLTDSEKNQYALASAGLSTALNYLPVTKAMGAGTMVQRFFKSLAFNVPAQEANTIAQHALAKHEGIDEEWNDTQWAQALMDSAVQAGVFSTAHTLAGQTGKNRRAVGEMNTNRENLEKEMFGGSESKVSNAETTAAQDQAAEFAKRATEPQKQLSGTVEKPEADYTTDKFGRTTETGNEMPADRALPAPQGAGEFVGDEQGNVRELNQAEAQDIAAKRQEKSDLGSDNILRVPAPEPTKMELKRMEVEGKRAVLQREARAGDVTADDITVKPGKEVYVVHIQGNPIAEYKTKTIANTEAEALRNAIKTGTVTPAEPTKTVKVLGQEVEAPATPTPAQAEAGNYKKPEVQWFGLPIKIENEKGSIRSGAIDESTGRPAWQTEQAAHYGYFKGSEASDKEPVDVYVGNRTKAQAAYVIDQLTPDGTKFDEPKVVIGVRNEQEARDLYRKHYPKGWKGVGAVTKMSVPDFKNWLQKGDTTAPVSWKPKALPKAKRNMAVGQPQHDSILEYLSKTRLHGSSTRGLNFGDMAKEGFDPADMRGARGHGINRPFTKDGGSLDHAAEVLHEAGYPVTDEHGKPDPRKLADLIDSEIRGNKVYSHHNSELFKQHEEDYINAMRPLHEDEINGMSDHEIESRMEMLERLSQQHENASADEWQQVMKDHGYEVNEKQSKYNAQKDAFDDKVAVKNEIKKLEREKDKRRNTGQESVETGKPDDLFSESRKQVDLSNPSGQRKFKLGDLPRDMREELFNEHATNSNPDATEQEFYNKRVPHGEIAIKDLVTAKIPDRQLADYLAADASKLPPIVISDGRLIDGQHRIAAAKKKGIEKLPYIDVTGLIDTNAGGFISELPSNKTSQTDTPEFKKWFGDSKVVDGQGKPRVVYHGTSQDFSEFNHAKAYTGEGGSQTGSGFYFTTEKNSASSYASGETGTVMPVYLSLQKPMHIDFMKGEVNGADLKLTRSLVKKIILSSKDVMDLEETRLINFGDIAYEGFDKVLNNAVSMYVGGNNIAALRNDFFATGEEWLRALQKATGYDSAYSVTPKGAIHYVAWFPEQIKSAIGNNGEFNPKSSSIVKESQRTFDFGDPYERLAVRPGTTAKQKEVGRAALSAVEKRVFGQKRGVLEGASILGSRISKDFRTKGFVSFKGMSFKYPHELAQIAQVARDPRFEHYRVIFMDEGDRVIDEMPFGSRLAGAVRLPNGLGDQINERKKANGSKKYWLLHNHPSGKATPSKADELHTLQMWGDALGLQGHVVIDHNEFGLMRLSGSKLISTTIPAPFLKGLDLHANPELPHSLLNEIAVTSGQVAAIAKKLTTSNKMVTIIGTSRDKVGFIAEIPMENLDKNGKSTMQYKRGLVAIKRALQRTGTSGFVFGVVPGETRADARDNASTLSRLKLFTDIIDKEGNNFGGAFAEGVADVFGDRPTKREMAGGMVGESQAPRGVSQTDTPEFKKWFGGSQVVDELGKPLVVYHGTVAYDNFTKFKKGNHGVLGPGMYFTDRHDLANTYTRKGSGDGRVMSLYLRIKNPLIVSGGDGSDVLLNAIYGRTSVFKNRERKQGHIAYIVTSADIKRVKDDGYDGIIWKHPSGSEYVVFDPHQIKSATDNSGAFDRNNPSIVRESQSPYMKDMENLQREKDRRDNVEKMIHAEEQDGRRNNKGPIGYRNARNLVAKIPQSELVMSFRRLIDPSNVSAVAKDVARVTRAELGRLAHEREDAIKSLERYAEMVDQLSPTDKLGVIDAIETGQQQPLPSMQAGADYMRKSLDTWREKIQSLGDGYLDEWIENYFPHYWQKEGEAQKFVKRLVGRRPLRGPATFLKKRTIPTVKDGIAAGLRPLTINPLVLSFLKLHEMQKFYSGVKLMQKFKESGLARFLPSGKPMPTGWTEIKDAVGRVKQWSEAEGGFIERGRYIMPEDGARVINNHLSASAMRDFLPAQVFRVASNALNALQLSFSAFHLGFTTLDAVFSKNAVAIERLFHGEPLRAAKAFLEASSVFGASGMNIHRGIKLLKAYNDVGNATPEMKALVDMLTRGGGRTKMDTYFLAAQGVSPFKGVGLASYAKHIKAAMTQPEGKVAAAAKVTGDFVPAYAKKMIADLQALSVEFPKWQIPFEVSGRVVRASSSLIMEHIVPWQKLGVFSDLAADYLRRNPTATAVEMDKEAQRIWASVDNRLGEMVYDNLFWNRTFKDSSHMAIRAVGWNSGTVREIGGAPIDMLRLLDKAVSEGKISADEVGHKIPYVIAMTITTMMFGAILTYLLTGKKPEQPKDYFFPPTGGLTKYGTKQRVSLPSYAKDVYEYANEPGQTAINKLNPIYSLIGQVWNNEDFFGNAIYEPEASKTEKAKQIASFMGRSAKPFSLQSSQQIAGSEGTGTAANIKKALPLIGITVAPSRVSSPDEMETARASRQELSYAMGLRKQMHDAQTAGDTAKAEQLAEKLQQAKDRARDLRGEVNPSWFVPADVPNRAEDPIVNAFKQLGIHKMPPQHVMNGVELSEPEYQSLLTAVGNAGYVELKDMVSDPTFEEDMKNDPETTREELDRRWKEATHDARFDWLESHPDLQKKIEDAKGKSKAPNAGKTLLDDATGYAAPIKTREDKQSRVQDLLSAGSPKLAALVDSLPLKPRANVFRALSQQRYAV